MNMVTDMDVIDIDLRALCLYDYISSCTLSLTLTLSDSVP